MSCVWIQIFLSIIIIPPSSFPSQLCLLIWTLSPRKTQSTSLSCRSLEIEREIHKMRTCVTWLFHIIVIRRVAIANSIYEDYIKNFTLVRKHSHWFYHHHHPFCSLPVITTFYPCLNFKNQNKNQIKATTKKYKRTETKNNQTKIACVNSRSNTLSGFSVRRITGAGGIFTSLLLRWFNSELYNYVTIILATISALLSRNQWPMEEGDPELHSSSLCSCY